MSRFIKNPIPIADGVQVTIAGAVVRVSGPAGNVEKDCLGDDRVLIEQGEEGLRVRLNKGNDKNSFALAGSYWRLLSGMVKGAADGAEKVLELVGVGYRAQVEGREVVLQIGFSHPVRYKIPDGITISASTQTELVIKGADKSLVGQTAADIRAYRPPEPYKGKGIRYKNERVVIKEMKKK